ncbi:helix-turn-helix transcriptional regulator [Actinocrispum sp. NPDC049592]|uniref:helix-turn-helix domain-containing protein n=1 Tax=Actinocrispum sp. NPDC049592 TaxID=3154835 RepID=UPI0034421804
MASSWSLVVPAAEVSRLPSLIAGTPDPRLSDCVLSYTANTHVSSDPWQVAPLGAVLVSVDLSSGEWPVWGLRDRPMTVRGHGPSLSFALTPAAAYRLLGVPLSEVANTRVDLADVVGVPAKELGERLASAPSWAARFRLVDRFLLSRTGPSLARPVFGAWELLQGSGGRMPISALADTVGWTRQHLVRRFREQIGLGPKTIARILRLHQAATLMVEPTAPTWATIAHRCGYADQAHLNRDFRALTGMTPSTYVPKTPRPFHLT